MVIRAVKNVDPKILEEEVLAARKEIFRLAGELAHLKFRTEQNQLDTALAASTQSRLDTLCQCAISKKGARRMALAMMERNE